MFTLALGVLTAHPVSLVLLSLGVLGTTWLASEPSVVYLQSIGLLGSTGLPTLKRKIVAKTADYAIVAADDPGTVFTTTGAAGAVNFTLPAVSALRIGQEFEFFNAVNQSMTVTAPAGTAITFNNAAATSLAASTANQKVGARIKATCDGVAWHLQGSTVGVTYTVA